MDPWTKLKKALTKTKNNINKSFKTDYKTQKSLTTYKTFKKHKNIRIINKKRKNHKNH